MSLPVSVRPVVSTLLCVLVAGSFACSGWELTGPLADEPEMEVHAAKGGNGGGAVAVADITVEDSDPREAMQDTTLDVRVLGSGFEPGAEVRFLVGGKTTRNVVTNATSFVSSTEVVANVSIALDADTVLYDIEVANGPRRRGVGTELFKVLEKKLPWEPDDAEMTITSLANGVANMLVSDGNGAYVGGACGVESWLEGDSVRYTFRPVKHMLNRKEERELERSCSFFPRSFTLAITGATVVHDPADPGDHSLDRPLQELVDEGMVLDPAGRTTGGEFAVHLPSETGDSPRASFNVAYCTGEDGRGSPIVYGTDREPDSDNLHVTRVTDGTFLVSTKHYPDNVGHCLHDRNDGTEVVLLLHLDLAYEVAPLD